MKRAIGFSVVLSAAGLVAAYGREPLTAEQVFARAAQGDDEAAAAIDRTCRRIAHALGSMINLLNLEACLIGGGISIAGEVLLAGVRAHLPRFTWPLLLANARLSDKSARGGGFITLDLCGKRHW